MIFDGLGEDLFSGLGPDERLGAFVVALDEMLDRGDQFGDVVVDARRTCCLVRIENQISTMFSQDAPVGVKWKCTRLCRSSQRLTSGVA